MNKVKLRVFCLYYLPVILWCSLIFYASSMPSVKSSDFYVYDFILKKTAHFTEYFILSLLTFRMFYQKIGNKRKSAFFAIIFCSLYAVSDEIHQSFVPGREPTFRDVSIDVFGSITAILAIWKFIPKMPNKLNSLAQKLDLQ